MTPNCGCVEWPDACVQMCRRHYGEMQLRWEIREWTTWGYPSWQNKWEQHAAAAWRFWFMRACF